METSRLVIVAVWLVLLVALARSAWRGRLVEPASRRIWTMFLLSALSFSLWGPEAEAAVDRYASSLPLALYVKYACLIWVCHVYWQLLVELVPGVGQRWLLDYLGPAALVSGMLSLALWMWLEPVTRYQLRYLVIGARDAVVLTYILAGFLSGTAALRRREQVPAMRLKQAAIVLFFISYGVSTLGAILAGVMTLAGVGDPARAAQALQPFLYPTARFFALMAMPYRWYDGLFCAQRLVTYYRLRRLERALAGRVPDWPRTTGAQYGRLWWGGLDLAIYRTVIAILDGYRLLEELEDGAEVCARIDACVAEHGRYADLVEALAEVRL